MTCTPGSHPHSDQPNWRPADTFEKYLQNCREGLEQYSDRRAAKLLGWSRARLWRAQLMAELPEDLFELLLEAGPRHPSQKALANVALALRGGNKADAECCPNCGHVLRIRRRVSPELAETVNRWLADREGGAA
jgi:hypothetical protein